METRVLFFLATLLTTLHATTCLSNNPIRLPGEMSPEDFIPNPYQVLRPAAFESHDIDEKKVNCRSWHLSVETNNLRDWETVPAHCFNYVSNYMQGKQYRKDIGAVVDAAIEYLSEVKLSHDGKECWIFDDGETLLSNVPYYSRADVKFGTIPYNSTKFNEWVSRGASPAVPEIKRLYDEVISKGLKIIILSGIHEYQRNAITLNLKTVSFTQWDIFILKAKSEYDLRGAAFKTKKRKELVAEGYKIIGNIGDQWTDLIGESAGNRTFKVPNPMYYV